MQSSPDTKTVKKTMTGDFFANETKLCKNAAKSYIWIFCKEAYLLFGLQFLST